MRCLEVVERRYNLGSIEGRIQWNEDGSQLENSVCDNCKFDVVAQLNTDSVSLFDPQALQSFCEHIAFEIQLLVRRASALVTRDHRWSVAMGRNNASKVLADRLFEQGRFKGPYCSCLCKKAASRAGK